MFVICALGRRMFDCLSSNTVRSTRQYSMEGSVSSKWLQSSSLFYMPASLQKKIAAMEQDRPQQQPQYIHRFPFRFVRPYPYTYKTFTKGRWVGKELLSTLVKEFKAYPPEYYQNAIITAKITVNRNQVPTDYLLKNGDQITHVSLRVEPPVLDLPVRVVHECNQFLVIDKPPSVIVHTGGGHHFNTIQSLLKYEYGFKDVNVLHRLDKGTSGLLIFSKNKRNVALFHEESGKETMKKMYFARVSGNFRWQRKELSAYIECVSHKDGVYRVTGEIEEEGKQKELLQLEKEKQQPVVASQRQQVQQVAKLKQEQPERKEQESKGKYQQQPKGKEVKSKNNQQKQDLKESRTIFQKVWYDQATDSSLVECYPITGRTHQIRVHLQHLGFPILNDVVYGGRFVGNKVIESIKINKCEDEELEGQPKKKIKLNEEIDVESWDYKTKAWEIMLHSFRYKFGGKEFKTEVPYWYYPQAIDPLKQQQNQEQWKSLYEPQHE